MKRMRVPVLWLLYVVTAFFFLSCGLPGELKKQAKQKSGQIEKARKTVEEQKTRFSKFKESEKFGFFKVYAEREDWEASFQEAQDELKRATDEILNHKVAALLSENKKEKATHLRGELARIDRIIKASIQKSKEPVLRMAELERIQKEAPELVRASENYMEDINRIIKPLETDLVPQAQKDFPERAEDINKRFAPLKKLQRDADAGLKMAQTQLNLHETVKSADYAILGDKTKLIHSNHNRLKADEKKYRSQVNQLYQSYTKLLADMRIDYYIQVGRVSWDEGSDWNTERNYIYQPSKVEEKVYVYFVKLNPNIVPARYSRGWGGRLSVSVDPAYWQALGINPTKNWYSRFHNYADFWVEDTSNKAYHKYILVQNGERKETDWVLVDEEDYYDYYDYLGMEIVSKPYGFFEDEKIKEASPPGMSMVGNKRYGEWRKDTNTGRSFWHYYGMYAFFFRGPSRYYYRDNWSTWRRDYRGRKPYFGGSGTTGSVYGTYGSDVRTDKRYRNSYFARKGGLRTQAASVRGAGPGRRGGGPGRRGK